MPRAPWRLLFGLIVVLTAGIWAGPQTVRANHAWGIYHWARSANPVSLRIGDNVTTQWDSYLVRAVDDWDDGALFTPYPDVLNLILGTGSTSARSCKPVTG